MNANALAHYDVSDNLKQLGRPLACPAPSAVPRILVGVDGSLASLAAVEHARQMNDGGGEIVLVNVQPAPAVSDARRSGLAALAGARALLDASRVRYKVDVVFGETADSLVRFATQERATTIVLGDSGRSALLQFLVGSTSRRVIGAAAVPVALVGCRIRATTHEPQWTYPRSAAA